MDIHKFVTAVLQQDARKIRAFFHSDAYINWHNTNEHFTVEEYIQVNCEYPGNWTGEIEKIIQAQNMLVVATHVYGVDCKISCHCTSFIQLKDDKIIGIDEYWGDDGDIPQWRKDKHIGTRIK